MTALNERALAQAAQAIYDSHRFVKPWNHPDTVRNWHDTCRREAAAAITAYHASEPDAVAVEREACAKLVENAPAAAHEMGFYLVAKQIRSRSQP